MLAGKGKFVKKAWTSAELNRFEDEKDFTNHTVFGGWVDVIKCPKWRG